MEINYNVSGPRRKEMVEAVSKALGGCAGRYLGAPSFSYQVGDFEITQEGVLVFDDSTDAGKVEAVLEGLKQNGFSVGESTEEAQIEETPDETAQDTDSQEPAESSERETETAVAEEGREDALSIDGLSISLPRDEFSDTALDNLDRLLESKGSLICKAFDIEEVSYTLSDERITFSWLKGEVTPEKVKACQDFIIGLCEMAKRQKRVTSRARAVSNEKYAFRCFLLRLGLIGERYKTTRKILMNNFSGSAAWRDGHRKETHSDEISV